MTTRTSWIASLDGGMTFAVGPFATQEDLFLFGIMILMLAAGGYLLYAGIKQLRVTATMVLNRPVGAGEVADEKGIVEVQGMAEPIEPLGIPEDEIGGKATALAYTWREVEITERKGDNKSSKNRTRTIDRERHAEPFKVVDESGETVVDPNGATLSLNERRITRGGRTQEYQAEIQPGDSVHIFGQKRTASNPEQTSGEVTHFIGNGEQVPEFIISDSSQLRSIVRGAFKTIGMVVVGSLLAIISIAVLLFEVTITL